MKFVTLLACIAFIASAAAECDPNSCPNRYYLTHYTELGCTPIYGESDSCCPERFDCSSRVGLPIDRCYYQGKELQIGEDLTEDLTPQCLVNCRCVADYTNPQAAQLLCVNIECPELFNGPPEEGCINLYENDKCCSTDQYCASENKTQPEVTCEYGGTVYVKGQRFYPEEEPCMTCLCQSGFNGSLVEPHCSSSKCNIEIHYTSQIRRKCVPVYYQDRCCPIDWLCPNESNEIATHRAAAANDTCQIANSKTNVCAFGSLKINQGEKLPSDLAGSCTTCECAIPPVLTCVKNYANC